MIRILLPLTLSLALWLSFRLVKFVGHHREHHARESALEDKISQLSAAVSELEGECRRLRERRER